MSTITERLLHDIQSLPEESKVKVLAYVQALRAQASKPTTGLAMTRFAGVITGDDAALMKSAIEKDCERIDAQCW